jgi:hypothetical protein
MFEEDLMDILTALKDEQSKLERQLRGIETAIAAVAGSENGSGRGRSQSAAADHNDGAPRRTLSAAGRMAISRAAKARWARIKAEKSKKTK